MLIHTIWASDDGIEYAWLIDAWDEYSVDGNRNGWGDAVKSARNNHADVRVVVISVDEKEIAKAFESPAIIGEVRGSDV